jgi:hypothetical protein
MIKRKGRRMNVWFIKVFYVKVLGIYIKGNKGIDEQQHK